MEYWHLLFEFLDDGSMQFITEVFHRCRAVFEHNGCIVVRELALGLGVSEQKAEKH
jgi:hypothetical protein